MPGFLLGHGEVLPPSPCLTHPSSAFSPSSLLAPVCRGWGTAQCRACHLPGVQCSSTGRQLEPCVMGTYETSAGGWLVLGHGWFCESL